jgi:hypothetical protein
MSDESLPMAIHRAADQSLSKRPVCPPPRLPRSDSSSTAASSDGLKVATTEEKKTITRFLFMP